MCTSLVKLRLWGRVEGLCLWTKPLLACSLPPVYLIWRTELSCWEGLEEDHVVHVA